MKEIKLLVGLVALIAAIPLAAPWVGEGIDRYDDWVYCRTHDFVQHSWNTNDHHCVPVAYT